MALGLHIGIEKWLRCQGMIWSGPQRMVCNLLSALSFPHFPDSLSPNWISLMHCPESKVAESKFPRVYKLSFPEVDPK